MLRLSALLAAAVLLHVGLGWAWTTLAGFAAGYMSVRNGWLYGMIVVGGDWLLLLIYNYMVDARAFGVMTETLGGILGNLPSFVIVAITLLTGLVLGLLGGATGMQLRRIVAARRATERS